MKKSVEYLKKNDISKDDMSHTLNMQLIQVNSMKMHKNIDKIFAVAAKYLLPKHTSNIRNSLNRTLKSLDVAIHNTKFIEEHPDLAKINKSMVEPYLTAMKYIDPELAKEYREKLKK